jgi:hypothetical protein
MMNSLIKLSFFFCFLAENFASLFPSSLLSIDIDLFGHLYSQTHGVPGLRISLLVQKSNAFQIDPSLPLFACKVLVEFLQSTDSSICFSNNYEYSTSSSFNITNELQNLGKGARIDPRFIQRNGGIVDDVLLRSSNQIPQWGNERVVDDVSTYWVYAWSTEKIVSGKFRVDFREKLRNFDVTYLPDSDKLTSDNNEQSIFVSFTPMEQEPHIYADKPSSIIQPRWQITAMIKLLPLSSLSLLTYSSSSLTSQPSVKTRVCSHISNEGFKKSLRYSTEVRVNVNQSNNKNDSFSESNTHCSIALVQRIPAETFIDLDEFRRNGGIENCSSFFPLSSPLKSNDPTLRDPEHFSFCAFTHSIDVERPLYSSLTTQHIVVLSRMLEGSTNSEDLVSIISNKGFVSLKAAFGLNFQLRYQAPGCSSATKNLLDDSPIVDQDHHQLPKTPIHLFKDGSFKLRNESGVGSGGCYRLAFFPRPSIHLSCRYHSQNDPSSSSTSFSTSSNLHRSQAALALLYTVLGGKASNDTISRQWVTFEQQSLMVDDDDDIESEDNLSCGMMPYLSVVPVGSTGDSFIVSAVTTGVTMICALMIIVSATFASITTKTKSTKSA